MKLHLGCGHRHLDGFLNIDARTDVNADLVADITALTAFADGDAELIYACHVFEHMPRPQIMDVLAGWHRILKPRGILRLAVPDFAALCKLYYLFSTGCSPEEVRRLMGQDLCGELTLPPSRMVA